MSVTQIGDGDTPSLPKTIRIARINADVFLQF